MGDSGGKALLLVDVLGIVEERFGLVWFLWRRRAAKWREELELEFDDDCYDDCCGA